MRGFRIELGEIEAILNQHPLVRESVAVAREDTPGDKRLVAYIVPNQEPAPAIRELQSFLKEKLPDYMVPSGFAILDSLPLTPNGKVDRGALPPPEARPPQPKELSRPRNALESELVNLWEEILDVRSIDPTQDFFELGGHSLLVAKLLLKIENNFGTKLTVATVFEAPTIRQLAEAIQEGAASSQAEGLIPIQPAGTRAPLFCVGGGPLFRPMAQKLGANQPFYSLIMADAEIARLKIPYQLQEIADPLVRKILLQYPKGPYYLSGWCLSGVVAFEMARQLINRGRKVELLVLFDSPTPGFYAMSSKSNKLRYLLELTRFHFASLRKLRSRELLSYLRERLPHALEKFRDNLPGDSPRPLLGMDRILCAATSSYRAERLPVRTVLFLNPKSPKGRYWDAQFDWTRFVSGPLEVHEVPGDHRSMFTEPNVEILAEKLAQYLDKD